MTFPIMTNSCFCWKELAN